MESPLDWDSIDSQVFINPRTPPEERKGLLDILHKIGVPSEHVAILTSGSSGKKKWVALKKSAFLVSAEAVNDLIGAFREDIWINCLPLFHVGGLSIYARAFLSNSAVVDISQEAWNPVAFVERATASGATLTSLVPTQLFDLVMGSHTCPRGLRAVFVGGGALSENLYSLATALGWPLFPTYGMTECASQVATGQRLPALVPLKHIQARINAAGFLEIASKALLTCYITEEGSVDPKKEGWFTTEDRVVFDGRAIVDVRRGNGFVKIGGENVDLQRSQGILEDARVSLRYPYAAAIVAVPDDRLGNRIELRTEGPRDPSLDALAAAYHAAAMPFERAAVVADTSVLRTPLGKLNPYEV